MSCSPDHLDGYIPGHPIRTDLAIEAHDVLIASGVEEKIPGVEVEEIAESEAIKISRVRITSDEGAQKMGKPPGQYVTIEAPGLRSKDTPLQENVSQVLARELSNLAALDKDALVMVIGLGNWNVTPDALGPRVVSDIFVTRHLMTLEPELLGEGFRSVAAFAPGVLAITGMETGEIIRSIVASQKPDLLIAIDALAAHRIDRLHTTIQMADSGVTPGSGVGNRRLGINAETVGCPVIALGVPTVVDAATIAGDVLDALARKLQGKKGGAISMVLQSMERRERQAMIDEVLEPYVDGRLIVTPKEIDTLIDDIAHVISGGINAALHPQIAAEDADKYLH